MIQYFIGCLQQEKVTSGQKAFQRVKAEEWLGKKGAIDNRWAIVSAPPTVSDSKSRHLDDMSEKLVADMNRPLVRKAGVIRLNKC